MLLAGGLVPWLGTAPIASADDWCSDDPLVTVVTPAGNTVQFHITVMAQGLKHLPTIKQSKVLKALALRVPDGRPTARDPQKGSSLVTVAVQVPSDDLGQFKTKVIASSGEYGQGTVYDSTEGMGGRLHLLTFKIDVP
jgi:hypothetical protein